MNAQSTPPIIRSRPRRRWLWVLLVLALIPFVGLTVLALGVVSYLHQSSDTRALRKELTHASGASWREQIGLNIGNATFCVARAGLSFVDMDAETRAALRTVRGVEVGIYELASGSKCPDRAAMLTGADEVMTSRGWERVVGVLEDDQMVGVYLPTDLKSLRSINACVVVLDGQQMVVVSARADLGPLVECLKNKPEWRAGLRSLASR